MDKIPTIEEFEVEARCSYAVLKKRFGGLRSALRLAGLESGDFHRDVSDEELLRELARIWDFVLAKEGRRPFRDDLAKYSSRFSPGPYYRRWGSWIRACEALLAWEEKPNPDEPIEVSNLPSIEIKKVKRPIPLRIRYAILMRDHFKCQVCGRSPATSPGVEVDVDHIVPESKGGTRDHSNLRVLCKECNIGKGTTQEW